MMPITARAIYVKQEAQEDPRSRARLERMLPFIRCEREPEVVDDARLQALLQAGTFHGPRHGTEGETVEPVVLFNQFLYHHGPEERARREAAYPELFQGFPPLYGGYGGFDWRRSGDEEYRCQTGLVCQPAYAIHSFWGCHFRCAYCNLGHVAHILLNLEDWADHIRTGLQTLENAPQQTLFQWDNGTDVVCWEPEYGGTKLLVDLFAETEDKYLELYVGKSDAVDYLLDYDHRGHTICCWSLCPETQCRVIEKRSASMEARIRSIRRCQEAGYGVRVRFSPMVPIAGWEGEIRHMIRRLFAAAAPDVLTIEPLRFCTAEDLASLFDAGVLDAEFVQAMETIPAEAEAWQRQEFPDALRLRMYEVVLDEVEAVSPGTPVALCREKRRIWDALAPRFERLGQRPDRYVCNCGPTSAGANPLLQAALPV